MSDTSEPPGCLTAILGFFGLTGLIVALLFAGLTIRSHIIISDQFRHALLDCDAQRGTLVVHGYRDGSKNFGPASVPTYRCVKP